MPQETKTAVELTQAKLNRKNSQAQEQEKVLLGYVEYVRDENDTIIDKIPHSQNLKQEQDLTDAIIQLKFNDNINKLFNTKQEQGMSDLIQFCDTCKEKARARARELLKGLSFKETITTSDFKDKTKKLTIATINETYLYIYILCHSVVSYKTTSEYIDAIENFKLYEHTTDLLKGSAKNTTTKADKVVISLRR